VLFRSADFLRVTTPEHIREVALRGRPERDMPAWRDALGRPEMEAIFGYIEEQRPRARGVVASGSPQTGQRVFRAKCAVCHGSEGEGGAIAPRLRSAAFLRIADDRFLLANIDRGRPDTAMPAWADLGPADRAGLLALFAKWRNEAGGARALPVVQSGDASRGASLYAAQCARCHGDQGQGGSALTLHNATLLEAASNAYLAQSLERCRESARGPAPLAPEAVSDVVAFLRSWRDAPRPVPAPAYRPLAGDAAHGRSLFSERCEGCHGEGAVNGMAPAIGSPSFLAGVSDGYLAATITLGRGNTPMPVRGVNEAGVRPLAAPEIVDVVAYLRSLAGPQQVRVAQH